jgi:cytochrome c2
MTSRQQLGLWVVAALAAFLLLAAILLWRHRSAEAYFSTFLVGDPHGGRHAFQKNGCGHCHPVNGAGTGEASDLGFRRTEKNTLNQLVVEMWNHAPEMWKKMRDERISYPSFSPREMADVFAYLYTARYLDEPGDAARGRRLFSEMGCLECHAVYGDGGRVGPKVEEWPAVLTPIFWAQAMWNHAPLMESSIEDKNMDWPRFRGSEMNDLLSFVRQARGGPQQEFALLPANPREGWRVFKEKACIDCHAVGGEGGDIGPDLTSGDVLASSLAQVAGQMWNHSPEMWKAMKEKGIARPAFEGQEMADLIAFLYSVRYFELAGSPVIGKQVFEDRQCGRCHGADAAGDEYGPRLRGRGKLFTPVTMARSLWSHGPKIYERAQELRMEWPKLKEEDLGHVLAFLNSPVED